MYSASSIFIGQSCRKHSGASGFLQLLLPGVSRSPSLASFSACFSSPLLSTDHLLSLMISAQLGKRPTPTGQDANTTRLPHTFLVNGHHIWSLWHSSSHEGLIGSAQPTNEPSFFFFFNLFLLEYRWWAILESFPWLVQSAVVGSGSRDFFLQTKWAKPVRSEGKVGNGR